jgi:hypothetical protein
VVVILGTNLEYIDEDEERKRKTSYKEQPTVPPRRLGVGKKFRLSKTPSAEVRSIARQAQAEASASSGSPLRDFFKMVRDRGASQAQQRVTDCLSIARRHYAGYIDPNLVWDMARSPFTIAQLDEMGKEGHSVLYNYKQGQAVNYIPASFGKSKDSHLYAVMSRNMTQGHDGPEFDARAKAIAAERLKADPTDYVAKMILMSPEERATEEARQAGVAEVARQRAEGREFTEEWQAREAGVELPGRETAVSPDVDMFYAIHNPGYTEEPLYQYEAGYRTAVQTWAEDYAGLNPDKVKELERLTGIHRDEFATSWEWELAMSEYAKTRHDYNDETGDPMNEYMEGQLAQFQQDRDKWYNEQHPDIIQQHKEVQWLKGAQTAMLGAQIWFTIYTAGMWGALSGLARAGGVLFGILPTTGMLLEDISGTPEEQRELAVGKELEQYIGGEIKTDSQRLMSMFLASVYPKDMDDPAAAIELQKYIQSVDEGKPAFGQGLDPNGTFDGPWLYALGEYADWHLRVTTDLCYEVKAGGFIGADEDIKNIAIWLDEEGSPYFITYDEETGMWTKDSEWNEALDDYFADQASKTELAAENPSAFIALRETGLPTSGAGFLAYLNRIAAEGIPSAFVNSIIELAKIPGGAYNAVTALIEYKVKMDKDAIRKDLLGQLTEAGNQAAYTPEVGGLPLDIQVGELDAAKVMLLAENGFTEDKKVLGLVEDIKNRELEIVYEPSYGLLGALARTLGSDYAQTDQLIKDHSDAFHAGNILFDLSAGLGAGFSVRGLRRGAHVTVDGLTKKWSFPNKVARLTEYLEADNPGLIRETLQGKDATEVTVKLVNDRNQADIYKGDAPEVVAKVDAVVEAAKTNDAAKVVLELGEYGKTPEAAVFVEQVIKKANSKRADPEKTAQYISDHLLVRQTGLNSNGMEAGLSLKGRAKGDVWGWREVTPERVSGIIRNAWAEYSDILPEYTHPSIDKKSATNMALESGISGIRSPSVRLLFSNILGLRRSPLRTYSAHAPDFVSRFADAVGAVTNDLLSVIEWRNRLSLIDMRVPGRAAWAEAKLAQLRNTWQEASGGRRFGRDRYTEEQQLNQTGLAMDLGAATGRKRPFGLPPRKGAGPVSDDWYYGQYYVTKTKPAKQVGIETETKPRSTVMRTSQFKHEVYLGGSELLTAKLKIGAGRGELHEGMTVGEKITAQFIRNSRRVRNAGRGANYVLNKYSNPLRITNVFLGFIMLFQKHFLVDPGRNAIDRGLGLYRYKKIKERFDANLEKAGTDIASLDYVNFQRRIYGENEQHYTLEGGEKIKRFALKAFDQNGKLINFEGVYNNIRLITADKVYQTYIKGFEVEGKTLTGIEAVGAWLDTPEGHIFLGQGGHGGVKKAGGYIQRAKEIHEELDLPADAEAIEQTAKDYFLMEAHQLYDSYAGLPWLSEQLAGMSIGEISRTPSNVRKVLEEAYQKHNGENPTLDVLIESGTGDALSFMSQGVRYAMLFNRKARYACFEDTYNRVVDRLRKEGVPEDRAAVKAATAAGQAVIKTHFDLSQASRIEMKFRYFAWFATKHRLWNSFLLRAAVKYPMLFGAVDEFLKWMAERNADDSIPVWEKHNIVGEIGGRRVSFPISPWFWLSKYALESPFALEAERGVNFLLYKWTGKDFVPESPSPFDFNLIRIYPAFQLFNRWLSAPKAGASQTEWVEWINDLPEDDRQRFNSDVWTAYLIHQKRGDDTTLGDACNEVLLGNWTSEMARVAKPGGFHIYGQEMTQLTKDRAGYEQVAGTSEAVAYLNDHPMFALTIGAWERDPWAQEAFTANMTLYHQARTAAATAITEAVRTGRIYTDPGLDDRIYRDMDLAIQDIIENDESGDFSAWLSYTGEGSAEFAKSVRYAFPAVGLEDWRKAMPPSAEKAEKYLDETLMPDFREWCAAVPEGLDPDNETGQLLYKILHHRYVDEPLAIFKKELPSDLTIAIEGNYRSMLKAGEFLDANQYMKTMIDANERKLLLSGTRLGKPNSNALFFALLTKGEQTYLNWGWTEKAYDLWVQYGRRRIALKHQADLSDDLTTSGTMYREAIAALDAEVAAGVNNPNSVWYDGDGDPDSGFSYEWSFSQLRLPERLELLGWGKGDIPIAEGWATAFDIEAGMRAELAGLGVGPTSGRGKQIVRRAIRQLAVLAHTNQAWFADWTLLGFGPSMFGMPFSARLTGSNQTDFGLDKKTGKKVKIDDILWRNDAQNEDKEFEEIYAELYGG